jgi:uncharacterized protein (DUF2141 family)
VSHDFLIAAVPAIGNDEEAAMLGLNGLKANLFALGLCTAALPAWAQDSGDNSATLTIRVLNAAPRGVMRVGLYTRDAYPNDKSTPTAAADVPAIGGETTIILTSLAPGEYAVEVYQDLNGNGKMDMSLLGIPEEPYGFSRDARPRLSKPSFDRVKFSVAAGDNCQTLHLQNTSTVVATN